MNETMTYPEAPVVYVELRPAPGYVSYQDDSVMIKHNRENNEYINQCLQFTPFSNWPWRETMDIIQLK